MCHVIIALRAFRMPYDGRSGTSSIIIALAPYKSSADVSITSRLVSTEAPTGFASRNKMML